MRKFAVFALAAIASAGFASCQREPDYFDYVSEYRHDVYVYAEDDLSFTLNLADRETPYAADGVKGDCQPVAEVYVKSAKPCEQASVDISGLGGEMSYLSVSDKFYLCFSTTEISGNSVAVKLNLDGKERSFTANNVRGQSDIDGKTALKCVREYDGDAFAALTRGRTFGGEISVRLLFDDGCFYYVGLCGGDGKIHAYLLDAANGRIIAEREQNV